MFTYRLFIDNFGEPGYSPGWSRCSYCITCSCFYLKISIVKQNWTVLVDVVLILTLLVGVGVAIGLFFLYIDQFGEAELGSPGGGRCRYYITWFYL